MKKIADIARLVIFILAGLGLYFYMSTAIAETFTVSQEDMLDMTKLISKNFLQPKKK